MLQLGILGKAQWDQNILNIPGGKKIYLEEDEERKRWEREKVLNICIRGANILDKYNLVREKSCVHLLFGKTQYQKSMTRE